MHGPVFGRGKLYFNGSNEIWHSDANESSYPGIIDDLPENDFDTDDYEVFQIVKK
jgi:hypothetical protein